MSWTKLAGPGDWDAYKARLSAEFGVGGLHTRWGDGPAAYPCLVASTLHGHRVLSCFVLPADARELLGVEGGGAAGETVVGGPAAPRGDGSDDTEFRRYVVAHLLTLVSELRSVKITNEERYEQTFRAFLADVDRATVSRATNVCPEAIFGRKSDGPHGS